MTTFSLMDVSVQLLKYSVNVSTTLCKNSITKSGGTEKKKQQRNTVRQFLCDTTSQTFHFTFQSSNMAKS